MKILTFCTLAMITANNCFAQKSISGSWEGSLDLGKKIQIIFNIKDSVNNTFYGTMDSPDQLAFGIKCNSVNVIGDSVKIVTLNGKAEYAGRIADSNVILGFLAQSGRQFPLNLNKTGKAIGSNRPQTPVPPFNYIVEDVIYYNNDSSIQYGATITIPKGKGSFPAILLITGSGQQNRDEEIFGHKPFAVIADYLTKKGYIVLRVDDQGAGKTTGDFASSTTLDFRNDAMVSLQYLRSRKEVNKQKIGLMGHSEGGMIAPMIASNDKKIDFIVLLAGPGVKIQQLMEEQVMAGMEKMQLAKEAIDAYLKLYNEMTKSTLKSENDEQLKAAVEKEVKEWVLQTPANIVLETTNISDAASQDKFVRATSKMLSGNWYKYFISCDPQNDLKKLSCKVLALNGEKDIQVIAATNLAGIKSSLAKSKSPAYSTIEMKGLNHLFQKCQSCTIPEYGTLEETFSTDALDTISNWLNRNVK